MGRSRARELRAHVRLRAAGMARRLCRLGVPRQHRGRQPSARRARAARTACRGRSDRLRGLRHRSVAGRSGRPRRASDARGDRRRVAAREADARGVGLRRNADGIRRVGPRGIER